MENTNIENPTVDINLILSVFKNTKEAKRLKEIKDAVVAKLTPEGEIFLPNRDQVESEIEVIMKQDKKEGANSELEYKNGKYSRRRRIAPPQAGELKSTFIGAAGECAVMSELLFRGYNVNRMMVDEGVDIIAVKNNIYYYFQVKTTSVKPNGNITCSIDRNRHLEYQGQQMRYVVVARSKDSKGFDRNIYFVFTPTTIEQAIYGKCLDVGQRINIKIKFNPKTGEPVLYDDKEMEIGFFMNNFD